MDELKEIFAFTLIPAVCWSMLVFFWNAFLAPGRLHRAKLRQLERLRSPEYPEVSQSQAQLLIECGPTAPSDRHLLSFANRQGTLNGKRFLQPSGNDYFFPSLMGEVRDLEQMGMVNVVYESEHQCKFKVTLLGCTWISRHRLSGDH